MDPSPQEDCGIEPWDRVWVGPDSAERLRNCYIPANVTFSVPVLEEPNVRKRQPRVSRRKEKTVEPTAEQPTTVANDEAVSRVVDDAVSAAPTAVTAHTAVPDHAPEVPVGDMTDIMGAVGGGPLGILALVVLVVGGGAGWKFWSKLSEQKHEQAMKRLEIESAQFSTGGAQPPPCQAKQAEVDAKLSKLADELEEMRTQVKRMERKLTSVAGLDTDDVQDRLKALEATIKERKAALARRKP